MAFIEESDYEAWLERKRREGRARAQRPESPWSLMPPAPASPMPGISASQPLLGSQTAPIIPAWAPPPPPTPTPTPWQQTQGRYTPEFDEPMPSFTPTPTPGIPLPGAPDTAQVRPSYGLPGFPMAPEMAGDIEALRRWKTGGIEPGSLPPVHPALSSTANLTGALGALEGYSRGVTAPLSEITVQSATARRPVPPALRPPRPVPPSTPEERLTAGLLEERQPFVQAAAERVGRITTPEQLTRYGEQWYDRGEPVPGVKGVIEAIIDPLNIPAGAVTGAGKALRVAAKEVAGEVAPALRAVDRAVTSPAVRRLAPGLGVEAVETPTLMKGLGRGGVDKQGLPQANDMGVVFATTSDETALRYADWGSGKGPGGVARFTHRPDAKIADVSDPAVIEQVLARSARFYPERGGVRDYYWSRADVADPTFRKAVADEVASGAEGWGDLALMDDRAIVQAVKSLGYDGVTDGTHYAFVRPNALQQQAPKAAEFATNAISGLPLGSAPEASGAVVGGLVYQDDPNLSPEENAQRRLLFAAGGAGLGYAGRRLGSKSRLGGTIQPIDSTNAANATLGKMYQQAAKPSGLRLGERWETARTAVVRATTDRDVDLAKFQKQAARAKGAPLTADEMLYEIKRLNPDKAAEVRLQEGLQPAIQDVGEDLPWLSVYLTHQDNIDVARAMGNQARKFSGGLSVADSQAALADMARELTPDQMAKIQQAADQAWTFGRQLLERKRDAGLITPQLYDDLIQTYPHYVPTRITDYMKEPLNIPVGKSLSVRDTGLRRNTIEGTVREREDPLASMVRNAYQTEALARKNEAFNAFVKLRDMDPQLQAQIRQVPDSYTVTRNEAKVTGFVNGVRQTYVVPKALEQVIKGEPGAVIPGFAGALWSTMMNTFRAVATSRNPIFLASNATLDAATYAIRESSRAGGPQALPRVVAELAGAYADAFRGVLSGSYEGDTARFLKGGGGMFGFFQGSPGEARATVQGLARQNVFTINGASDIKRLVGDLLTLKPVEGIGERIELAPRVASMRLAEKAGANPVKAVINGRTVTMDFAQGGNVAKVINQFSPFFNVGVQAPAQMYRAFRENPKGFIATMATLIGGPTVIAEAWNRSDPQRAKDYEDVPQYLKDQGIVIMWPSEAPTDAEGNRKPQFTHIKLREFAPFAVVAREAAGRAMGAEPRDWWNLINGTLGSVSPIQGSTPADAIASFTPLGVSTGLQLASNQDYFRGRMIATKSGDERASALSKAVGKALGVQPSQVEFTVRDLGAGVGGMALAASDLAAGKPAPSGAIKDVPVVGGFAGRFVRADTGDRLNKLRGTPVSPAAKKLLEQAGVSVNFGPVSNTIKGVPLKDTEEEQYQRLANQYIEEAIQKVTQLSNWGRYNADQRTKVVKDYVGNARERAGSEVLRGIGAEERKRRLAEQKKAG